VVAGARAGQVGVVERRGDAHGARAPDVHVAQVVGELLHLVSRHLVLVHQHVVMGRSARALRFQQISKMLKIRKLFIT